MYHTENRIFKNEKDMLGYLSKLPALGDGVKTAIVGGHFMLLYDKESDKLRPMIWQDLEKPGHVEYSKIMAGDFPVRTFNYSVELYRQFKNNDHNSGLVLLINDHKFQHHNKDVNGRGGKLRKNYYQNQNAIPKSFQAILNEGSFDNEEVFINYNNSLRQKQDLLPKKTIMYSEQVLRNRFEKHVKPEILKNDSFREVVSNGVSNLFYHSKERHVELCLTEDGTCGCSGEVVEFVSEMLRKNIRQIILFSPSECEVPVNIGVEVALNLSGKINDKPAKVFIIAGIGGMGEENIKEDSGIRATQHFFNC